MAHNESVLRNGERLHAGEYLRSKNGLFHAFMQEDGNFVVYRGDLFKTKPDGYEKTGLWSVWPAGQAPAGGTGYHLYMQTDGNLCIYRQDPQGPMWACPETMRNRKSDNRFLELFDDGRLDIHNVWGSKESDGYGEVEFDRIDYVLDPAPKVTSLGAPGVTMAVTGNNPTSAMQEQTISVSYQEGGSNSWKISTSLKMGLKTKVTTGIPGIVAGEVEASSEFTSGFEWNKVSNNSKTVTIPMKVNVPPGKKIAGKCTWRQSSLSVPYVAVGRVKFDGYPEMLPVHLEGTYEGTASHDVQTSWKEMPADLELGKVAGPVAAAAIASIGDDGWHLSEQVVP